MIPTVHLSVRIRDTEYPGRALRNSDSDCIGAASIDRSLHLCGAGNLKWSEAQDGLCLHPRKHDRF